MSLWYNMIMIIGITGTLGAGKGTIVRYLVEKHGFRHYSVRVWISEEIARRGLPINRDTMASVGNDVRAQYGSGYISEQLVGRAVENGGNAVIESVRSLGEAGYLQSHGAHLWAVDANLQARYQRITDRASETDHVSLEKFVTDERREFENTDPTKQNISGVMGMADTILHNDGTPEELYAQIEEAFAALPA